MVPTNRTQRNKSLVFFECVYHALERTTEGKLYYVDSGEKMQVLGNIAHLIGLYFFYALIVFQFYLRKNVICLLASFCLGSSIYFITTCCGEHKKARVLIYGL